MAVVTVGHHPELTPETAMEIFQRKFEGKYHVRDLGLRRSRWRQFVVEKSTWVGVYVGLEQESGKTSFAFNGGIPSARLSCCLVLVSGIIGWLILQPRYREMEAEVKSFLENAPEFKGDPSRETGANFCSTCGGQLTPGGQFCTKCGAPVA